VNTWIAGTRHGLSLRTASVALSFFANLSDYFNTLSAYAPARQQEMALFKRVVLRCRSTMFALRVASHLCGIAHSVKTLYSKRTELSGEDKVFDVLKIVAKAVFTYVALTRLQRTYQELQKVNTVVDRAYRFGFGSVLEDEPTTDACGLGPLLTKSGFILSEDEWRKGIRQRNTQIRMPRSNT